ncbi:MAG: TetR family transcriptional regulator [Cyclobacteriaceae bacterium]|nr:MAG: TetR family transcriptional regulator [Cyclobacteriaceae bacterium]
MASRGTTSRRILELAESLLQRLGYNGFSYHHLSQELGIKNAAIHYHFPTKEDLGLQIVEQTRKRFNKWCNNPENRILPVKQQLDWLVQTYHYNLKLGNRVCLIGALATDYYTLPASMQNAVKELSYELQHWTARLLENGRESGVMDFKGRSNHKALCILSTLTGSLQLARLLGNERHQQIVDQIYLDLNLTY